MKIKPEALLNSKNNIDADKILITGSDEALINYVKQHVLTHFKKRNFFIDISDNYNGGLVGNLFSEKKTLFVLSNFPTKKEVGVLNSENQSFLVASPNGKKTNAIKFALIKQKNSLVIECYSLNRASKEDALKYFVEKNKLDLSNDVFWYMVDSLDDNYVIFIKQLETIKLFNKKIDLISDIEKIIFLDRKIEVNKIFFKIFKDNKIITTAFNESINTISDFYYFLHSTKLYLEIIKNSPGREFALASFPKYLFAEKDVFSSIYTKINKGKLIKIYRNISRVELLTRQNPELYLVIGLRFFINLKKIITS